MLRRWRGCPSEAELRSLIEDEAAADEDLQGHLQSCARCASRLSEMTGAANLSADLLRSLDPDKHEPDMNLALQRLNKRINSDEHVLEEAGMIDRMWGRRSGRAATAVIGIFALLMVFTLTPVASVADDFLDRFRVTKFAAITIDMEEFDDFGAGMLTRLAFSDQERLETAFTDLGDYTTTFDETDPYANVTEYGSVDEARSNFGDFKMPGQVPDGYQGDPRLYGSESGSVSVDVNTAQAQMIIDELGMPIYSLPDPDQVPTMTFTMDVPESLVLEYAGQTEDEKLMVVQMASPVLHTPDGLDMDALREDLLAVPGLPPDFVAQLRSIEDWEETLIIPVPEGASSRDVTVDGNPGLLVQADDGTAAMMVWESDGQLIIVGGTESGETIEDVAQSLD